MDFVAENADEAIKPKAMKKPGGTFASMGLSRPILKAVERRGYKLATPIQRKCIPLIMSGRDVVAMARTGSGKSAAFLLPLIDKLKIRQPKADIRALIISPTRELANQTYKFVREFSKFTNLISKLVIGGESINHDFETITSCPDILVATPGRLAHVLVEMKQKLNGLEIVVFDEADRLFEPGYKEMEQVNEICQRLPESKQTLLFSATIPQRLAEFAKADLKNPQLVRLDVETNLSETLKSVHIHCNQQDKFAILVHLLKNFVSKEQMTVVFMPTKHHIEYARMLLTNTRIDCCSVYSSMDPEARKINIDRFTKKSCKVMLVTDIAARGIDIPLLDIVINFNFPFKPKLYIHRVGRVARAGRLGSAISLISHDETPYLHNLHLFFGIPMTLASELPADTSETSRDINSLPDKVLGTVPQGVLDDENDILKKWHEHDDELSAMVNVCENAMKPYLKSREPPCAASVKISKEIHRKLIGIHPIFRMSSQQVDPESTNFLDQVKSFKPRETIFEVGHIKGNKRLEAFEVMRKKREFHDRLASKKANQLSNDIPQTELSKGFEDQKFYLKYQPDDYAREKGLGIEAATLDLVADEQESINRQTWDRKRKKFVKPDHNDANNKKIRTESGTLISASYSSGLFDKWKRQSRADQRENHDDYRGLEKLKAKLKPPKLRWTLKNPEEILKDRNVREKQEKLLKMRIERKSQRKNEAKQGESDGTKRGRKNGTKQARKNGMRQGKRDGAKQVKKNGARQDKRGGMKQDRRKGARSDRRR